MYLDYYPERGMRRWKILIERRPDHWKGNAYVNMLRYAHFLRRRSK